MSRLIEIDSRVQQEPEPEGCEFGYVTEWISLLIKLINLYYFYKSYGTRVISIPFKKFKIIYFIKFILSGCTEPPQ